MRRSTVYAFSAFVLVSSHTMAQSPPAAGPGAQIKRIAGTVQSVSENKMTVVSDKGETTEVVIPADAKLGRGVDASRAELAAAKLANCNATGASGTVLRANQCGIIPADTKMVNSGHFPEASGATRTVGNVTSVKGDPSKEMELVISYKDGQQRIVVPASAKVTKGAPITLREIKPGDQVVAASRVVDGNTSIIAMVVTQK